MQDYQSYWSQKLMLETLSFLIFSIGFILIFCGILSFYLMKKEKKTQLAERVAELAAQLAGSALGFNRYQYAAQLAAPLATSTESPYFWNARSRLYGQLG